MILGDNVLDVRRTSVEVYMKLSVFEVEFFYSIDKERKRRMAWTHRMRKLEKIRLRRRY